MKFSDILFHRSAAFKKPAWEDHSVMKTGLNKISRRALAHLAAFAFLVSLAQRADAHASLVHAEPGSGAAVKSTHKIDLWFNELLEDRFNTVQVIPASQINTPSREQTNLTRGATSVDPKDRTHLTATVTPLQPGEYIVRWRVLSRDGHSAPGQLEFRVTGGH
jgi:methionine-rich copper-binding protein CopC